MLVTSDIQETSEYMQNYIVFNLFLYEDLREGMLA